MNLYRLKDLDGIEPCPDQFSRTLAQAKALMQLEDTAARKNIIVELVAMPEKLDDVILVLNGNFDWTDVVLRKWRGTARGGLLELDVNTSIPLNGEG